MKSLASGLVVGATGALVVIVPMGQAAPLALRSDGIEFPHDAVQTTAAAADPGGHSI